MGSQNNSSHIPNSFSTYADYIEAEFSDNYRRYAWLGSFLRHGLPRQSADSLALAVRIVILDCGANGLKSRRFSVTKNDTIDPALVQALKEEPESSQTRLVFLQYRHFDNINPSCVDLIGLHCDINPEFFCAHFECDFNQAGHMIAHYPSHSLPSERRFLQIKQDDWTFMTTTWKISEQKRTFVVFALDHYMGAADQISALNDQLVHHTSPAEIMRLNQNPADYLFFYVREAARRGASICAQLAPFREGEIASHNGHLDTKWDTNQRNRRAMMFSLNSLSKFLGYPEINPKSSSLQLSALLSDYRELIQETEIISADLQALLQQQANLASIQQARRAVEQTDSVRRLSVVAFLFIPLSFATSFFGMNVKELGTGPLSIGFFFLLAILSAGLCVILAVSLEALERFLTRVKIVSKKDYRLKTWIDN